MATAKELRYSRRFNETDTGRSGEIHYRVTLGASAALSHSQIPKIGDVHPDDSQMFCNNRVSIPLRQSSDNEGNLSRVEIGYSTRSSSRSSASTTPQEGGPREETNKGWRGYRSQTSLQFINERWAPRFTLLDAVESTTTATSTVATVLTDANLFDAATELEQLQDGMWILMTGGASKGASATIAEDGVGPNEYRLAGKGFKRQKVDGEWEAVLPVAGDTYVVNPAGKVVGDTFAKDALSLARALRSRYGNDAVVLTDGAEG